MGKGFLSIYTMIEKIQSLGKQIAGIPLSHFTTIGLQSANYFSLTCMQQISLPFTLCGRDVLGVAKTGSGKTLAYLIPIVEILYRQFFSDSDILGGAIITTTRELATQICGNLHKIVVKHSLTINLLIGGKHLQKESANIFVCTPGRLLQHLKSITSVNISTLEVLIMDEADRLLSTTFYSTINNISVVFDNRRQTMLFSATKKKNNDIFTRFFLFEPKKIEIHLNSTFATPVKLLQFYCICKQNEKLNFLWLFIRA